MRHPLQKVPPSALREGTHAMLAIGADGEPMTGRIAREWLITMSGSEVDVAKFVDFLLDVSLDAGRVSAKIFGDTIKINW
jgi:hypothetical protein